VVDVLPSDDAHRSFGGSPVRFRVRHLLYLLSAVSFALGIPGLRYIIGWIVFPWLMFVLIVSPVLVGQFLFMLLIPSLRHDVFGQRSREAHAGSKRRHLRVER
jgi:hypothetical protein